MNPIIQREQVPAYAAWRPEGWEREVTAPAEAAEPPIETSAETLANLARLEQQAREKGHEQGFAEGRLAGLERGRLDAQAELDSKLKALTQLFDQVARPLDQVNQTAEEALAQLAMAVAERLVAHELHVHPERVVSVVRQAVQALPMATDPVTIHLHPADIALVKDAQPSERPWRLVEDPTLVRGECVINTPRSRLDARIKTRLAAVAEAALGANLTETADE